MLEEGFWKLIGSPFSPSPSHTYSYTPLQQPTYTRHAVPRHPRGTPTRHSRDPNMGTHPRHNQKQLRDAEACIPHQPRGTPSLHTSNPVPSEVRKPWRKLIEPTRLKVRRLTRLEQHLFSLTPSWEL